MRNRSVILISFLFMLLAPVARADVYATLSLAGSINLPSGARMLAHSPKGPYMYVIGAANLTSNSIYIINTNNLSLSGTINIQHGIPMDIAFKPDGKKAYVALSGALGSMNTGDSNGVAVINTDTRAVESIIPLGGNVFGPARIIRTANGKLVVPHRVDSLVFIINENTLTLERTISLPMVNGIAAGPVGLDSTSDSRIFVAGWFNQTLYEINSTTGAILATIPLAFVGHQATAVAVHPLGHTVYVSSRGDHRIFVVGATPLLSNYRKLITTIDTQGSALESLDFDRNGNYLFALSGGTGEVKVIGASPLRSGYHSVLTSARVGGTPFSLDVHPSVGTVMYVSNREGGPLPYLSVSRDDMFGVLMEQGVEDVIDVLSNLPSEDLIAWQDSLTEEQQIQLYDTLGDEIYMDLVSTLPPEDAVGWLKNANPELLCTMFSTSDKKEIKRYLRSIGMKGMSELFHAMPVKKRGQMFACIFKKLKPKIKHHIDGNRWHRGHRHHRKDKKCKKHH